MKKLVFASLLTAAVVSAQAVGSTGRKAGTATEAPASEPGTTKTKKHSAKPITDDAKKSGSGGHGGGGSGAGKLSGAEATKKFGGSHGDDTPSVKRKTGVNQGVPVASGKGGKKGVNKAGKQPPAKRPEAAPPAK